MSEKMLIYFNEPIQFLKFTQRVFLFVCLPFRGMIVNRIIELINRTYAFIAVG